MKRPRTATVLGTAAGLALIAIASHVLPGCSAIPPYMSIGLHWTTLPGVQAPTPPPPPAIAATPSAAARP